MSDISAGTLPQDYQYQTQAPPPTIWQKIGGNIGTAGYDALNEAGIGLPDWIMRNLAPKAASLAAADRAKYPVSGAIGTVAGLLTPMAGPVGLAYKVAGDAAKALRLGKTAGLLNKAFDVARGATPVTGALRNFGKGVLQAAPQALGRMATGNITPTQGLIGLGAGGALQGVAGLLGSHMASAPNKFWNAASEENNKAILGMAGVGQRDLENIASYHVPGRNIAERTRRAKNLIQEAADLKKSMKLYGPEDVTNFYENTISPEWNKIGAAYQESGKSLLGPDAQEILNSPNGVPMEWLTSPKAAEKVLGGDASKIVSLPSWQDLASKYPAHAQQLMKDIAEANAAGWQDGRKILTDIMGDGAMAKGRGATQLKAMGDAAGDIKNLWDNVAQENAVQMGAIAPNTLEELKRIHPAVKLLQSIPKHAAYRLNKVAPNSNTAAKMMLGAVAGGASGNVLGNSTGSKQPLLDTAIGAALGMAGGDILNQLTARGVNAIGERTAMKLKPLLDRLAGGSGGGGRIGAEAAAAASGAFGRGAQEIPGLESLFARKAPQIFAQEQNPVTAPVSQQPPTIAQLVNSGNPWDKTIGERLMQNWETNRQFSGQWPNINAYVADMWKQTDGLAPVKSSFLLSNNEGFNSAIQQDMQRAAQLQNINWRNLDDWFSKFGGGANGPGPLLSIGAALDLPGARQANQDLSTLINVTQKDPTLLKNVEMTMRLPNKSWEQKKAMVLDTLLASHDVFANSSVLSNLGLL